MYLNNRTTEENVCMSATSHGCALCLSTAHSCDVADMHTFSTFMSVVIVVSPDM